MALIQAAVERARAFNLDWFAAPLYEGSEGAVWSWGSSYCLANVREPRGAANLVFQPRDD